MAAMFTRIQHDLLKDRIDATFYSPEFVANEERLKRSEVGIGRLNSLVRSGRRAVYFSTNTLENGNAPAEWVPFLTSDDLGANGFFIDINARRRVSPDFAARYPNGRLRANELLVKVKGPNQITAYNKCEPDRIVLVSGTIWGALVRRELVDPHYLVTALSSNYAATARARLRTNLNVEFMSPVALLALDLPLPKVREAQAYIGDKVRQAERLRQRSRARSAYALRLVNAFLVDENSAMNLEHDVSQLLDGEVLTDERFPQIESKSAHQLNQLSQSSRIPKDFLTPRLDCNFYNRDALELDIRFAKGYEVATFGDVVDQARQITNGVRGPDLQPSMFKLVRLQDFVGWSIDFDSCLTISEAQFRENRRCQLQEGDVVVAIGGYIGHAAMARRVQPAVIGQHSAVLPIGTHSKVDAGFLVAFLSSNAGAIQLQRYVSGTVQVGINLEDLRQIRLPLPIPVLQKHIGDAVRQADDCSYWASRLLSLACRLVEALIEGRITESELCEAYVALNEGDRQADRSILERVTVGGLDVPHESPLPPDFDGLYAAIDEAERGHTGGATSY